MHGLEAGEVEVASVVAEEGASVTGEGSTGVGVVASMAAGVGASTEGVAVTRHSNFATISWLV